jgi:hypothetical protein
MATNTTGSTTQWKQIPQNDGSVLYTGGGQLEYKFDPVPGTIGKWYVRLVGGTGNAGKWKETGMPADVINSLHPPIGISPKPNYPITTMPDFGDNPDTTSIFKWLMQNLGTNYPYYDNLTKSLLEAGTQASTSAMDMFNTRMQELARLLNTSASNLESAKNDSLSRLDNATKTYTGFLGQALGLQNQALSANPLKYQAYIDSGTLPEGLDSQLRTLRSQSIDAARTDAERMLNKTIGKLNQQASAMGMADSDYAASTKAALAGDTNRNVLAAQQAADQNYLNARLALPYQMQEAATSTMQSYQPFIQNLMSGGETAAGLQSNAANALYNMTSNNATTLLDAAQQQAQLPLSYYQMGQDLATPAQNQSAGYLSTIMNIWNTLMNASISNNQNDSGGGLFDWLF